MVVADEMQCGLCIVLGENVAVILKGKRSCLCNLNLERRSIVC